MKAEYVPIFSKESTVNNAETQPTDTQVSEYDIRLRAYGSTWLELLEENQATKLLIG